jgi:hypothetical protein
LNVAAVADGAAVTADDVWDGGTEAIASAVGIDGGTGTDTIINTGTVTVGPHSGDDDNMAEAYANAVSFALNGFAGSVMSSTATATSTGIAGGGGTDVIRNDNLITVDATADAWTLSVSGNYQGAAIAADAVWDGGTTAEAAATAIVAGDDDDQVENNGTVNVNAEATTDSTGVSGSVYGVAGTVMSSTAHTWSAGIAGGGGDDTIQNTDTLTADATSEAGTNNFALDGAGVAVAADAVWDGGTTAEATAVGLDGGPGDDTIINTGTITVGRDSDDVMAQARSTGVSGNAAGFTATVVTSTARTRAIGIYGSDGADTIENRGTITVDGTSRADSQNIALTAAGVSGAVDAVWDGGTTAEATAVGIEACKGADATNSIANYGTIDVGARAEATSTGVSSSLAGGLSASIATSTARVESVGIQGGDYTDTIYNEGSVTADGYAETDTVGVSATWVGATVSADAV